MKKFIISKFPSLLEWKKRLDISLQEKKVIPNKTSLLYSKNTLYANPFEKRGLSLLYNKGQGQPNIKKYWRLANKLFNPDAVIDVGANYGEVFLDCFYESNLKGIIAIEANPFLCEYLNKSKAEHSKRDIIHIYNCIASDTNQEKITFFIDKASSGRSTPLKNNFVKDSVEVSVKAKRIDDIISALNIDAKTIVFKIDVEGFEPFVIKGMEGLFSGSYDLIGCIEFNLPSFAKNNINVEDYLFRLNQSFGTLMLKEDGSVAKVEKLSIETLKQHLKNKNTEGDILLFSNQNQKNIFYDAYNAK